VDWWKEKKDELMNEARKKKKDSLGRKKYTRRKVGNGVSSPPGKGREQKNNKKCR
jgi:hypothetical protein